jgi:hypothetical protein
MKDLNIWTSYPTVIPVSIFNLVPSVLDTTFNYISCFARTNPHRVLNPHTAAETPVIGQLFAGIASDTLPCIPIMTTLNL